MRQAPPPPPPLIPANELRPGRHWYVTAAATAVALIVLGVAIGVYRFTGALDAVDEGRRFSDGDTVTLRLGPGSDQAIWIAERGPSPAQKCGISGPGDPRLTDPDIDVFLTRHETWNPLRTIEVSRPGDYEITCSSEGPSRYAIGDRGGYVTMVVGLIAAVALPALGILIGTAIAAVTAVRRRAHRGRLLAGRHVSTMTDHAAGAGASTSA
ncbi:hypothetical protein [Streptomyces sp. NPDC020607]|uniref:hypothetical protein n=1 Tax=Streptomyces sp. NPDC020607 TaxID=3365082 RepID=UPI0037AD0824